MEEYKEKTEPLLKEFRKKAKFVDFEAKRGVKDYPTLKGLVKPILDKI